MKDGINTCSSNDIYHKNCTNAYLSAINNGFSQLRLEALQLIVKKDLRLEKDWENWIHLYFSLINHILPRVMRGPIKRRVSMLAERKYCTLLRRWWYHSARQSHPRPNSYPRVLNLQISAVIVANQHNLSSCMRRDSACSTKVDLVVCRLKFFVFGEFARQIEGTAEIGQIWQEKSRQRQEGIEEDRE